MAAKVPALPALLLTFTMFPGIGLCAPATGPAIPSTQATALDGHTVVLPRDISGFPAILILGFGRHSADATTAWEKPVRAQLAQPGKLGYYDMAMLAEVPGFVRPLVLRAIKHAVPDVVKPHFLPLTTDEAGWKQVAGYQDAAPEAAYVLLVDAHGNVRWSTHQAYSNAGWQQLTEAVQSLAAAK
ncbi:MAG TPA: hypothetical protein VKV02_00735 [Acidobacteriaceae bacterium]|nr:hypothetical protein [Acidobacteriaceae bacterium]